MDNQPIKIDLTKIPNMKCYCGTDVFEKVFNLKYISSILCGDPQGGTAIVFMYRCTLCKQLYPKATTAAEVEKIYDAIPPDHQKFIDELRLELKKQKDALLFEKGAGGVPEGNPE